MSQTYTFDGVNKIIKLENTSSFSIADAYSRWKDWVVQNNNAMFPQAFRYVGGDPTTPGNYLGITYFLTNNWKFQPTSSNHVLDVDGNIYSDNSDSPDVFIASENNANVTIRNTISNINQTSVIDAISGATLDAIENKIKELWQLHGLDIDNPLTVSTGSRTVDDINQVIETDGNETIVIRT